MTSENLIILISNLTHDPEIITTPAGMITTTFNLFGSNSPPLAAQMGGSGGW